MFLRRPSSLAPRSIRIWTTEMPARTRMRTMQGQQVVSVEATNYMQLLNVTGVFGFDFSADSFQKLIDDNDPLALISPVASSGGKGGVGGAIFISLLNNTTTSLVEDGAGHLQRRKWWLQHEGRRGHFELQFQSGRGHRRQVCHWRHGGLRRAEQQDAGAVSKWCAGGWWHGGGRRRRAG